MEENRSTITYDEGWQSVSAPELPVIAEPSAIAEEETAAPPAHTPPKQLLITVQLILCLLIALAAFVLKSVGGEVYQNVRQWYASACSDSAVFDGRRVFELSALLPPASADEA